MYNGCRGEKEVEWDIWEASCLKLCGEAGVGSARTLATLFDVAE
jgi:ABC-type phosphonate transport system ATPase subunit